MTNTTTTATSVGSLAWVSGPIALIMLIVGVMAIGWAIVRLFGTGRHPESAASHTRDPWGDTTGADSTGRGTLPGDVVERPAGPDAENQAVPERGEGLDGGPPAGPPA